MPQVAVVINGKTYRMACGEGEEAHLLDLAKKFDGTIAGLKSSFGEIGDERLTVMAGVMLTDELAELQKKVAGLEADLASSQSTHQVSTQANSEQEQQLVAALNQAAERIESIGRKLMSKPKAG